MFKDYIVLKEKSEREAAEKLYKKSKQMTQNREGRVTRRDSVLLAVSPLKLGKRNSHQQRSRSPSPINGFHYKQSGILNKSVTALPSQKTQGEETKRPPPLTKFEIEDPKEETPEDYDVPARQGCGSCFFGFLGFGKKKKKNETKKSHPAIDHGELVGH